MEGSDVDLDDKRVKECYEASMLLAMVGDAVGYNNGRWEFRLSTQAIHDELKELTKGRGMSGLHVTRQWIVSDDSVMHLATAEALTVKGCNTFEAICPVLAGKYKNCFQDMTGRAPGKTTGNMCRVLDTDGKNWRRIPFNNRGGGCGGPMRIACIGLRFPLPSQRDDLLAMSIEACRMTHHHPAAYLGAVAAALFTALAIARVHPTRWGAYLLELVPRVRDYIKASGRAVESNIAAMGGPDGDGGLFAEKWKSFLSLRGLPTCNTPTLLAEDQETACCTPIYPSPYGVAERDALYRELSFRGVNFGSSGFDVVLIPYDALVGTSTWNECCHWAVLHAGDNDTTGTIAGAWWGAYHGLAGVSKKNYEDIEYKGRAITAARKLNRKAKLAPSLGVDF